MNYIDESCRIGNDGFSFTKTLPRKRLSFPYKVILGDEIHIGEYTKINRGTVRNTKIGDGTVIDSHVAISHDVQIGKNCEINSGAKIMGHVTIGDNCKISVNTVIHQKCTIPDNCVVGAMSYLRGDITNPRTVSYGIPARIKKNTKWVKSHQELFV